MTCLKVSYSFCVQYKISLSRFNAELPHRSTSSFLKNSLFLADQRLIFLKITSFSPIIAPFSWKPSLFRRSTSYFQKNPLFFADQHPIFLKILSFSPINPLFWRNKAISGPERPICPKYTISVPILDQNPLAPVISSDASARNPLDDICN